MAVIASASALITWAEYKSVYGISDDEEQDRYQRLINLASARLETHCQRRLKARDYTGASALVFSGSGTATLVCPEYPLNSVTSITIDGTDVTTEIYFHPASGVIQLTSGRLFPDDSAINAGQISIVCNAGYADTALEWPTLQTAAFVFVRWMAQRFAGGIGKKSETSADGMSVSFEIDIPLEVRTMLDPFMRRGHA